MRYTESDGRKTFSSSTTSKFDGVMKKWKKMTHNEREEFRDQINTRSMFSRCEEISEDMLLDEEALDRGDFVILRFVLEENSEYQHDHLAFIRRRSKEEEGFKVIYITDISTGGETPKQMLWTYNMLKSNMKEKKASLVRFNFLDIQDPEEAILERVKHYKVPKTEVRPLHFAYQCLFGLKEPIFSEEHLRLCEDNALIEIKSDIPPYAIPMWLRRCKKGMFHVSFQENDQDVQILAYEDIVNISNMNENDNVFLYVYPGVKIHSLHELMGHSTTEEVTHHTIHSAVEVSLIHAVEHGVSHALSHTLGHIVSYAITAAAAQGSFGVVHFAVAGAMAAQETKHIRHKEKTHKQTGGLRGLSGTRAKKEVTKTWVGAGAGAGGSVAIGLGVIYGASIGSIAPGVGTVVGGIVGGVVGSLLLSYGGKKVAGAIYDKNIHGKCPFC